MHHNGPRRRCSAPVAHIIFPSTASESYLLVLRLESGHERVHGAWRPGVAPLCSCGGRLGGVKELAKRSLHVLPHFEPALYDCLVLQRQSAGRRTGVERTVCVRGRPPVMMRGR